MKKIFFIINSISGGVETLLKLIIKNLNVNKYEIGIMEIIHDNSRNGIIDSRVRVYPFYTLADAPDRKERMFYVYHEWDQVIEKYIPQDYDLYISFNYLKPSFLLPPGKKCIAWIHGDLYDLAAEDKTEERLLQDKAFYKAKLIVTVSDITTQSVVELFPEHKNKIRVLYNGIDVDEINKKALDYTEIVLEHPAILAIGRLDKNKNPFRMLRVFKNVNQMIPEAHLYFLGAGKLKEDVRELSQKLEIEDHVHMLGYHVNPYPIIAQCDVVGMFSISEGFPMALLEAVSLGKAFVSSAIGGAAILSNGGKCGRVISSDEEAAEALVYFILKNKVEQREECQEFAKLFDVGEYIRQVENLFDTVFLCK